MMYSLVNPHNILGYFSRLSGVPNFRLINDHNENGWLNYELIREETLVGRIKAHIGTDGIDHHAADEVVIATLHAQRFGKLRLPFREIEITAKKADKGAHVLRRDWRYFLGFPWTENAATEVYPTEIFLRDGLYFEEHYITRHPKRTVADS